MAQLQGNTAKLELSTQVVPPAAPQSGQVGAACHFHQFERPAPVCVVTTADGQKVIATSEAEGKRGQARWAVRSATITLTRLWSSSTATLYLTTQVPDLSEEPPFVPFGLHPEQQIAVYLGYLEAPRPVLPEDIEQNRLLRVFIGVVDTISAACTGRVGYSLKVQCRDRVRWFMDSALVFNLTQDEDRLLLRAQETNATSPVDRAEAIWFILNSAIGRDGSVCNDAGEGSSNACNNACQGCGVTLIQGEIVRIDPAQPSASVPTPSSVYGKKLKGRVTNEPATDPVQVRTNIYVTRPYLGSKFQSSFMLVDNSALETIKRLSYMETYPTEFFQDPHTGELYYAPRGIDISGLDDPQRFYRRYFVRYVPQGMEVQDINQMALSYKQDVSTINLRTNIVVGSTKEDGSGDNVVHFKGVPVQLIDIPFACKYAVYQDSSIGSVTEGAYVALAWSREQGKLLRGVEMTVIGDPSLALGEAIQIISSPLWFDGGYLGAMKRDVKFYENEKAALKEWVNRADAFYLHTINSAVQSGDSSIEEQFASVNGTLPDGSNIVGQPPEGGRGASTDVVCRPDIFVQGEKEGFYKEDLPTLWRVESIVHHFKSTGFVTQLYLGGPF